MFYPYNYTSVTRSSLSEVTLEYSASGIMQCLDSQMI